MTDFRVIQGCPVNATLAPYLELLRQDSGCSYNSLYRGPDARELLNRHGKRDQAQLYRELPAGVANPPGRSTHELRSDGVAYLGPVGRRLEWWQQGIDVDDADVPRLIAAATRRGWLLRRPYASGVERHHLNFVVRPRAKGPRTTAKLIRLRAALPRS